MRAWKHQFVEEQQRPSFQTLFSRRSVLKVGEREREGFRGEKLCGGGKTFFFRSLFFEPFLLWAAIVLIASSRHSRTRTETVQRSSKIHRLDFFLPPLLPQIVSVNVKLILLSYSTSICSAVLSPILVKEQAERTFSIWFRLNISSLQRIDLPTPTESC